MLGEKSFCFHVVPVIRGPHMSALGDACSICFFFFPASGSTLLCSSSRRTSSNTEGKSEPTKQLLKKAKLPVGRLDEPEESNVEREPLEKFPDGINPTTKERGGPKGPEPTRYGDWERKGRCIDF
ncbi:succinate dehydrogenase assembly factor 4, mitochondrial isoform X1 [Alligator mississippiensis]|uniref:succinate dehydrogenase assembly factor 4, mitochondrial isoform X1 n=1 Tax=Alligator mississippiensis TaxID=8496 RepID=UPI000907313D|nr:succinate dehydrogenase assembly factor 4, mitochondrial isoform X1 [Alligator mississippiensis]